MPCICGSLRLFVGPIQILYWNLNETVHILTWSLFNDLSNGITLWAYSGNRIDYWSVFEVGNWKLLVPAYKSIILLLLRILYFLVHVPLLNTALSPGSSLFHAAHWKMGEPGIQFDVTSCTHVPNSPSISNKVIDWSPLLETVNTHQRTVIVCTERQHWHILCIFPLLFHVLYRGVLVTWNWIPDPPIILHGT